jgi:hypothetical protein
LGATAVRTLQQLNFQLIYIVDQLIYYGTREYTGETYFQLATLLFWYVLYRMDVADLLDFVFDTTCPSIMYDSPWYKELAPAYLSWANNGGDHHHVWPPWLSVFVSSLVVTDWSHRLPLNKNDLVIFFYSYDIWIISFHFFRTRMPL